MSEYNKDDLAKLGSYIEMQDKAGENLDNYFDLLKKIKTMKANINFLDKEMFKRAKKITELENDKTQDHSDQIDLLKKQQKLAKENINELKKEGTTLSILLNTRTKINATIGTTVNILGNVTKKLIAQSGYLLSQQKAVKMTQLQMGILSNESKGFSNNLYDASINTNLIGVNTKDLAKMQSTYSSEIGRAVTLTQSGNEAMAELAEGTILGTENAAQFAASMETFNYSVEASRDFMEESMNLAHSMGLNSISVTENIKKSLRIAQTYNFKGGIKGVQKMANLASKFKLELESVSGFAEKVFNPEGAIEMASSLSILGGKWATLGDPFKLMFKARTDMAGLTEDITKASASTAQFNRETGNFDIASMDLHRLREVSKATGISLDELTESARKAAKFSKIKTEITGNFDDDIRDFISARGFFDQDSKEFKINLNGSTHFVKNLNKFSNDQLSIIAKQQASLNEKAKKSKTFDETFENIVNQFKSVLLPGFQAFSDSLSKGLYDFTDWAKNNNVFEHLQDVGRWVGDFGANVVKLIAENPIKTGIAYILGKSAIWLMRGRLLGVGFKSVAGMGGGISGGGKGGTVANGMSGGSLKKLGGSAFGKLGAAAAGGKLLYDGYQNFQDEELNAADAILKTLDKSKGALAGAALGMVLGPAGAMGGAMLGGMVDPMLPDIGNWDTNNQQISNTPNPNNSAHGGTMFSANKVKQDFVSRPGKDPISFSSADTLIGMKKGGGIDNSITKSNKKSKSDTVSVNFNKPLKIEGNINVSNGSSSFKMDLSDPLLMRELSKLVQQEISTSLNGKRSEIPVN